MDKSEKDEVGRVVGNKLNFALCAHRHTEIKKQHVVIVAEDALYIITVIVFKQPMDVGEFRGADYRM